MRHSEKGVGEIKTRYLSPEDALAKYGEEWPHLDRILPPGTKPTPGIEKLPQRFNQPEAKVPEEVKPKNMMDLETPKKIECSVSKKWT